MKRPPTTVRIDTDLAHWVAERAAAFGGQSALINAALRDLKAKEDAKLIQQLASFLPTEDTRG